VLHEQCRSAVAYSVILSEAKDPMPVGAPFHYHREYSPHSCLCTMPNSASLLSTLTWNVECRLTPLSSSVILSEAKNPCAAPPWKSGPSGPRQRRLFLLCHPERSEGPHARSRPFDYRREFSPICLPTSPLRIRSLALPWTSMLPNLSLLPCHSERSEEPMHCASVEERPFRAAPERAS
jgi:hypothetical protein